MADGTAEAVSDLDVKDVAMERRVEEAIRLRGRGGAAFNATAHPRDREGKFREILGRIARSPVTDSNRGGMQGLAAQSAARALLSGATPEGLDAQQHAALMGQLDAYLEMRPDSKDAAALRSRLAGHSPEQAATAAELQGELAKARRSRASGPRHGGYVEGLKRSIDVPHVDSIEREAIHHAERFDDPAMREWNAGHMDALNRSAEIARKHQPEPEGDAASKLRAEGHNVPGWMSDESAHEYAKAAGSDALKGQALPGDQVPLSELKPGARVRHPDSGKRYTVVGHGGGTGARGITTLKPDDPVTPDRRALSHERYTVISGETKRAARERSVATRQVQVGDVVHTPTGAVTAGTELHVHRSDTGAVDKQPVEGSLEDAKALAHDVLRDPGVHRVAIHDAMREKEIWSTDDGWFKGAPESVGSPEQTPRPKPRQPFATAFGGEHGRPRVGSPSQRQTFEAFGVTRRSDAAYTHASKDAGGKVRFHTSERAARRQAGSGQVQALTSETATRVEPTVVTAFGVRRINRAGQEPYTHAAWRRGAEGALVSFHRSENEAKLRAGATGRVEAVAPVSSRTEQIPAGEGGPVDSSMRTRLTAAAAREQAQHHERAMGNYRHGLPSIAALPHLTDESIRTLQRRQDRGSAGDLAFGDALEREAERRIASASATTDARAGLRTRGEGAIRGGKVGRYVPIRGSKLHVPRDEEWRKTVGGGVVYDSPAGGTDVYRTGPDGNRQLVSTPGGRMQHPELTRRRWAGEPVPTAPPSPDLLATERAPRPAVELSDLERSVPTAERQRIQAMSHGALVALAAGPDAARAAVARAALDRNRRNAPTPTPAEMTDSQLRAAMRRASVSAAVRAEFERRGLNRRVRESEDAMDAHDESYEQMTPRERRVLEVEIAELAKDADVIEAADSMAKASTPEPFSKSKTSNWVARAGGLPAYVQHIAHDLMEKRGMSESKAIQMAIGIVKNWASGQGKVDANTRAAARKAVSEWEAKKASAHASK